MVEQSIFSRVIANNPSVVHHIFEALPEPTFLIDAEGYYIEAWGGTDSKRHHDPANLIGLNQYQVLPREKSHMVFRCDSTGHPIAKTSRVGV